MTFMTVTYELQKPLTTEQYRALGNFANTYGLQRFRFDEKTNYLHFDYDASRLTEFQFLGNLFVEKKGGGSGLGSGASRGRVPVIRTRRDRIMGSSILASL